MKTSILVLILTFSASCHLPMPEPEIPLSTPPADKMLSDNELWCEILIEGAQENSNQNDIDLNVVSICGIKSKLDLSKIEKNPDRKNWEWE